ncbi:hypothetical protein E2C01_096477 [Portunus trituberculatus]|uniref:Uncharacterized protein n=1 Tax=Portunus trituberculatus TaxID=210409 RepID=A0A5B7K739_PORTR|nr:hypothetical protein [Portunus trituberculatus]
MAAGGKRLSHTTFYKLQLVHYVRERGRTAPPLDYEPWVGVTDTARSKLLATLLNGNRQQLG